MFELALFDMDGLMVDTERACFESWKYIMEQLGGSITEEEYVGYAGHRFDEIQQLFRANHREFERFDEFFRLNHLHFMEIIDSGVPLKPGLIELLDALDALGRRRVIVSSSGDEHIARVLRPSGVQARFQGVVSGDRVKHSKPNPEIFLLAAESYGVRPENCLVFEDSIAGVMAATAAGMPVIAVPDMLPLPTELAERCLAVCGTLADAIPVVQKLA